MGSVQRLIDGLDVRERGSGAFPMDVIEIKQRHGRRGLIAMTRSQYCRLLRLYEQQKHEIVKVHVLAREQMQPCGHGGKRKR